MSFNFITTNTNLANAYSIWPYLIFMAITQLSLSPIQDNLSQESLEEVRKISFGLTQIRFNLYINHIPRREMLCSQHFHNKL